MTYLLVFIAGNCTAGVAWLLVHLRGGRELWIGTVEKKPTTRPWSREEN